MCTNVGAQGPVLLFSFSFFLFFTFSPSIPVVWENAATLWSPGNVSWTAKFHHQHRGSSGQWLNINFRVNSSWIFRFFEYDVAFWEITVFSCSYHYLLGHLADTSFFFLFSFLSFFFSSVENKNKDQLALLMRLLSLFLNLYDTKPS